VLFYPFCKNGKCSRTLGAKILNLQNEERRKQVPYLSLKEKMNGKREREENSNSDSAAGGLSENTSKKTTQSVGGGDGKMSLFGRIYMELEMTHAKWVLHVMFHHQQVLKKPFVFKKEQEDIVVILTVTGRKALREFMTAKYGGYLLCHTTFRLASVDARAGNLVLVKMSIRSPYDDERAGQMVHKGLVWADFIRNLKGDLIKNLGNEKDSNSRKIEEIYDKYLHQDASKNANTPVVICDPSYMSPHEYNDDD
jgi:hypothetical protein